MRLLVPPALAVLVLLLRAGDAAAAEDEARPDLHSLKSRFVEVRAGFLVPVLDSLIPPARREVADIRTGMGLDLTNKAKRPLWVSVRLLSPPAGRPDERFAAVASDGARSVTCALDTVHAGVDYLFDILVFGDPARTDTLEAIHTRIRFDRGIVHSHVGRLARARWLLPATKLPQSYENMLQDKGAPGGTGRLTVWPDHFEFVTRNGEQIVGASEVGAVYLSDPFIKVHVWRGGLWHELAFGHRKRSELESVLRQFTRTDDEPTHSEQLDRAFASLQSMLAQREPSTTALSPPPKEGWFKRLAKASVSSSVPPPPVAEQEEARLVYGTPTRKGWTMELGMGWSHSTFPHDSLGVLSGGGFAISWSLGKYLTPNLAINYRASLQFTEIVQIPLPIPTAVCLFAGPAVQYWVTDRWFLGAGAGLSTVSTADGPSADAYGVSGRVGYVISTGRTVHLGATLEALPGFYPGGTANAFVLAIHAQATGK